MVVIFLRKYYFWRRLRNKPIRIWNKLKQARRTYYLLFYFFGFSSHQIALGTVTNVDEAVEWLSYTYLYIRMRVNPLAYGIPYGTKEVCSLIMNYLDNYFSVFTPASH